MWWLELCRHNHEVAGETEARGRRLTRALGAVYVLALFAASIWVQLSLGGAQAAAVSDVALLLGPGLALWSAWAVLAPIRSSQPDSLEVLAITLREAFRKRRVDRAIARCLLGWCVKAFFLPLMLGWVHDWLSLLYRHDWGTWPGVFAAAMALLYSLDVLFATVGYLSTHRAIGAQIRSVDITWLGWLSALVCYPPLSAVVLRKWLDYSDGVDWVQWLAGSPIISFLWGGAIVLLTGIYTWSTVVFGPRFSNLTHRGIITSGPYRWTKHPAYISKNLSWWLIAVPFISSQGCGEALANCLALLGVNAIYLLRAKTEERHLKFDPVYRQYTAWIDENGLFARFGRLFHRRLLSSS